MHSSDRLLDLLRRDPRIAIGEEIIVCLVCGRAFRQLTNTHLRRHGLTVAAYKERYGYNVGRAMMCEELRRGYALRAIRQQLAGYIRQRPIMVNPELRRRGGRRALRLEERLTRWETVWGRRMAIC